MPDSDNENYVYFGTALQDEVESRAGQHSKALQDPSLTKSLPVWKQVIPLPKVQHLCFASGVIVICSCCQVLSQELYADCHLSSCLHIEASTFKVCHVFVVSALCAALCPEQQSASIAGSDRCRGQAALPWSLHRWLQCWLLQYSGVTGGLAAKDLQVI